MSIVGGSYDYDLAPLWKILPGLTTVKFCDGELDLAAPLHLNKLRELCMDGIAVAELCENEMNKPDKVASAPFSGVPCRALDQL